MFCQHCCRLLVSDSAHTAVAGFGHQRRPKKASEEACTATAGSCYAATLLAHLVSVSLGHQGMAAASALAYAVGMRLCCLVPTPQGMPCPSLS